MHVYDAGGDLCFSYAAFILKASLLSCAHFPHLGPCGFSRQLSNDEKVRIMLLREVLKQIESREISCRDRDVSHEAWLVRRGRAKLRVFHHTARHVWMPADDIVIRGVEIGVCQVEFGFLLACAHMRDRPSDHPAVRR